MHRSKFVSLDKLLSDINGAGVELQILLLGKSWRKAYNARCCQTAEAKSQVVIVQIRIDANER